MQKLLLLTLLFLAWNLRADQAPVPVGQSVMGSATIHCPTGNPAGYLYVNYVPITANAQVFLQGVSPGTPGTMGLAWIDPGKGFAVLCTNPRVGDGDLIQAFSYLIIFPQPQPAIQAKATASPNPAVQQ